MFCSISNDVRPAAAAPRGEGGEGKEDLKRLLLVVLQGTTRDSSLNLLQKKASFEIKIKVLRDIWESKQI